jgi:hypothetical protein
MAASNRFGSPGCMIMVLIRGVLFTFTSPMNFTFLYIKNQTKITYRPTLILVLFVLYERRMEL